MQDVLDIQVTPLSPACGAEIGGVDLTRPLSPATVKAIRDAWNKYIVLVFRGQDVSQEDQLRFASYWRKRPWRSAMARGRSPTSLRHESCEATP